MTIRQKIQSWLGTGKGDAAAMTHIGLDNSWVRRLNEDIAMPTKFTGDYMEMFMSIPEVFFPINYIASRIAGAHFEIRRASDDSIVYCSNRTDAKANKLNRILTRPNCLQRFPELVYMHAVYQLATGNSFWSAAMGDAAADMEKWEWCDNFWVLPAPNVTIEATSYRVPVYGIAKEGDIIKQYRVSAGAAYDLRIAPWQVWHTRDGIAKMQGGNWLKSDSRLESVRKPIENLLAVYHARNIIYTKRGALGWLVAEPSAGAELGTRALTEKEKKGLYDMLLGRYGVEAGQLPIGVTDVPLRFVQTAMSIQELQPFDEALLDAITIAGVYGIPPQLVSRRESAKYSDLQTAEKGVYTSVIIPMAERFCAELTQFIGLDRSGYYVSCNFNGVDCLQAGLKEAEQVKKLVNDRCAAQFAAGLISINDWRAQMHESALEGDIFAKPRLLMTEEERAAIDAIVGKTPAPEPEPKNNATTNEDGEENTKLSD